MLRIPNRQKLLPPLYHTAVSVQKMPTCELLSKKASDYSDALAALPELEPGNDGVRVRCRYSSHALLYGHSPKSFLKIDLLIDLSA